MHRNFEERIANELRVEAAEELCAACGRRLWVTQRRVRYVERLDGVLRWDRCDKRCPDPSCSARSRIFRPLDDVRIALPNKTFGLDVTCFVGEQHLLHGRSLTAIGRELVERGIPIDQTHVGELFRNYVALSKLARGTDDALKAHLRELGGAVLMADGVQFDHRSPVLYVAWDARTGTPLYGESRAFKGKDDLVEVLERVKAMDFPIAAIVSDKERGLVPAFAQVFPGVPHQYCQFHFLENCALPLGEDLQALSASVSERAEAVRKIEKRLHERGIDASTAVPVEDEQGPLDDEHFVAELCGAARVNARVSGRAPLDPPELVRHRRLEVVRQSVELAQKRAREGGRAGSGPSRARRAR